MGRTTDTFWTGDTATTVIERRLVFAFGKRTGELTVSIALDQPVPDLAAMSEAMLDAASVSGDSLRDGATVAPQFVFATVCCSKTDSSGAPVVITHGDREVSVLQIAPASAAESDLSMEGQMKAASAAMPTAAVAPGDYAVGFFVRQQILHFYPLLAVTLPGDLESYRDSSATTTDLVPLLPFQVQWAY